MVLIQTFSNIPVAHYVRKLRHKKGKLTVGKINYEIGLLCGNTDLFKCPHGCSDDRGFYAQLYSPKYHLTIVYQCDTCFKSSIYAYKSDERPTNDEWLFITELMKI